MQRFDFRAMGCHMLALMDTNDPAATEALTEVPNWFAEWEAHLSRFLPDSELSRLNQSQDKAFQVGDVVWQVLEQSLDAARASGGLVTPAVLNALESAGYDRTFDELVPSNQPSEKILVPDWSRIQTDPAAHSVRIPQGMRLDFGGVAKGWSADQAVHRLSAFGPALVDAGGDIALSGPLANGAPWPVAIADPFVPERDLALLMLEGGAVATSGRDYRHWERNGRVQHHIIDPSTGQPAETDVLSATVVAASAVHAEIAAKVAFILGSEKGIEWLERHDGVAGLLVLEDGHVVKSEGMASYLWKEPEDVGTDRRAGMGLPTNGGGGILRPNGYHDSHSQNDRSGGRR